MTAVDLFPQDPITVQRGAITSCRSSGCIRLKKLEPYIVRKAIYGIAKRGARTQSELTYCIRVPQVTH